MEFKKPMLKDHSDLLENTGCFEGEYHITVAESVQQYVLLLCSVTYTLQKSSYEELNRK